MDDLAEKALPTVTGYIHIYFRSAAMAAGMSRREFHDWAESMAGLGIAVACHKIDKFDPERGCFTTYAIYKTREEIRASLRENHRFLRAVEKAEISLEEPIDECGGVKFYVSRDEAMAIYKLLNESQQQAIALEHDGYNANEIAQIMRRKSHNTIRTLLRRARIKSRELLSLKTSFRNSSRKPRGDTEDGETKSYWTSF